MSLEPPDGWMVAWTRLRRRLAEPWQPVPRGAFIVACAFYALFLLQAARGSGVLLTIDLVFVPVHEGGHLFFGWFGEFIGVAGGTLMQLGVPTALAVYFAVQRHVQGATFCAFFAFEQLLPVSVYMADARAQALPLLTVGDSDDVIHDWHYLFGRLGVLQHDMQIAHAVRFIGWIGMLGSVLWMVWRSRSRGAVGVPATDPSEAAVIARAPRGD